MTSHDRLEETASRVQAEEVAANDAPASSRQKLTS